MMRVERILQVCRDSHDVIGIVFFVEIHISFVNGRPAITGYHGGPIAKPIHAGICRNVSINDALVWQPKTLEQVNNSQSKFLLRTSHVSGLALNRCQYTYVIKPLGPLRASMRDSSATATPARMPFTCPSVAGRNLGRRFC